MGDNLNKVKYNSFLCPVILLDALDDAKKKLPGLNLNIAKVLFLATTYMMENEDKVNPKILNIDEVVPMKKAMVRVTPPLLKRVKEYEKEHNLNKTDIYTIAFSNFLNLLFTTIKQVEEISYAKSVSSSLILVLDSHLNEVLKSNFVSKKELLIRETFKLRDEALYHIVDKEALCCLILENCFKDTTLDPKKVYRKLF